MKKLLFILALMLLTGASCSGKIEDFGQKDYNWSTMDEGPYGDAVSYATSTDLLHWTDSQITLAEHSSVPGALYKDGIIYVYFTDVSEDGQPEQIGFIKSEDQGQTWSTKEILKITNKPEEVVPVDLTPFLTEDGKIRLYYFDISQDGFDMDKHSNQIYSAISDDGVNFTQDDGVRFEKVGIYDPEVIKVENTYYLYVGDNAGNNVLVATSSDGLNFEYQGIAYAGGAIPDVIYEQGQFYLYLGGIDIATSLDGLTYEKTNYFFRSDLGEVTADPGVIKLGENSYLMLYKYKIEPVIRKMN